MSGHRYLVVFDTPEALVGAARRLGHVRGLDAHTPYHMPDLLEILPLPSSPVRPVMLAAGAAGAAAMFGLQVYNSVWGYPMNHGGGRSTRGRPSASRSSRRRCWPRRWRAS